MKRILNDGTGAAEHQARTSQAEDEPSPRRARLGSPLTPPPEGMPADSRRAPVAGTLAPRTAVFPARFGLTESPTRGAAPTNEAEIDEMIQELLEQPGELHFAAQPLMAHPQGTVVGAAPQSRVQAISRQPDAPPPYAMAATLLQANEQDIEAAIAAMRRHGLTREAAEQATGLRAGALAAVVDAQGRWLDEQEQSEAVNALPPALLQAFLLMLERVRGNSQIEQIPVPTTTAAAPLPGPAPPLRNEVSVIRTRVPRQDGEPVVAWARRIHRTDAQVRALPYRQRILVLAGVTGTDISNLRSQPALGDMDPQMAQLVQDIRARVPRRQFERPTHWARRIHEKDAQVRALPYKNRIAVLAVVTEARKDTLRSQPVLRDMSGPMAQQALDIRKRVPHWPDVEKLSMWARRIYETDAGVRELPYNDRISLLAMVTGVREADLRSLPTLRDISEPMARRAHEIRTRVPRQDGEAASRWAQRIFETDMQVQALPYLDRISALAVVTGAREHDLRADRVLGAPSPADGDASAGHSHASPSARP